MDGAGDWAGGGWGERRAGTAAVTGEGSSKTCDRVCGLRKDTTMRASSVLPLRPSTRPPSAPPRRALPAQYGIETRCWPADRASADLDIALPVSRLIRCMLAAVFVPVRVAASAGRSLPRNVRQIARLSPLAYLIAGSLSRVLSYLTPHQRVFPAVSAARCRLRRSVCSRLPGTTARY